MRRKLASAEEELWLIVAGLATLLVACTSPQVEVDREHCTKLRDRLVELRLATLPKDERIDANRHRAAMKRALDSDFVSRCQNQLSASQLECGLRARDFTSAVGCTTLK